MGLGPKVQTQKDQTVTQTLSDVAQRTLDPGTQAAIQQGFAGLAGGLQQRLGAPLNLQFQDISQLGKGAEELGQRLTSQRLGAINLANQRRQQQLGNLLNRRGSGSNTGLLATLAQQGALSAAQQRNQALGQAAAQRLQTSLDVDKLKQAALASQNQQLLAGRQLGATEATPALNLLSQLIGLGTATAKAQRDTKSQQETLIDQTTKKRSGLASLF